MRSRTRVLPSRGYLPGPEVALLKDIDLTEEKGALALVLLDHDLDAGFPHVFLGQSGQDIFDFPGRMTADLDIIGKDKGDFSVRPDRRRVGALLEPFVAGRHPVIDGNDISRTDDILGNTVFLRKDAVFLTAAHLLNRFGHFLLLSVRQPP